MKADEPSRGLDLARRLVPPSADGAGDKPPRYVDRSGDATPFRHIVLVGLSGSGKSTVGRLLAERLGRRFVDTDEVIVARAGKPIPLVFEEQGEAAFRAIESEAVEEVVNGEPAVIATGGGAPVDPVNRNKLWHGNRAVWLDAPVDVLVRRVGKAGDGRPLLSGDAAGRLATLRAHREAIYGTAHIRLDTTSLGPHEAVEAILTAIETQP